MDASELIDLTGLADQLALAWRLGATGHPLRAHALALAVHEACAASERRLEEAALAADAADCLADCCLKTADYELGINFARLACAAWESVGDQARLAGSTSRLAQLLADLGDPDSVGAAEAALALAERSGETIEIIRALEANGVVLVLLKQPDSALPFAERSVALAQAAGAAFPVAKLNLAETIVCAALLARRRGETESVADAVDRALVLTRETLDEARRLGDGWLERLALNNVAEYSMHVGDVDTAAVALAGFGATAGEPTQRCRAHHGLMQGQLHLARGRADEAVAVLRAAHVLAFSTGYIELAAPCAERLSEALEQQGDHRAALAAFKDFHALFVRQASEAAQRRARVYAVRQELDSLRFAVAKSQRLAAGLEASNEILAREAERQRRASLEDPLTGLTNRRGLAARFSEVGEEGRRYAFAIVDVDHFKRVNDTFSHQTGDAVLRRVAQLLAAHVRAQDLVARYGGEEFAVLMHDVDRETAAVMSERLRRAVADHDWADVQPGLALTVSIGVATSDQAAALDAVIARADARLYEAKRGGRNRVVAQAHAAEAVP